MTNSDTLSLKSSDDEDPSSSSLVVVPEDVLIKVFSWLPVKSLLRFKCLNKRWLHIISNDSYFIHLHSHHFKSKPPLLFFSSCLPPGVENNHFTLLQSSIDMEGRLLSKFEISKNHHLKCPGTSLSLYRPLMFPTHFDLVCFICSDEVHVCNPSTHELITLPPPPLVSTECSSFGFGYVESTHEYKIVHLVVPFIDDAPFFDYDPNLPTQCAVFTLGMTENSPSSYASPWAWKIIGNSPFSVEHHQCPAFVDGAFHWIINRKRHPELMVDIEQTILAFNLEIEEFRLIPRPRGCSDLACIDLQLVELRGLLCLSCVDKGNHKMDIWMLKEYCNETRMFTWVKEYSIDLSTLVDTPYGSYSRSDLPFVMTNEGTLSFTVGDIQHSHSGCFHLNVGTLGDIRSYSRSYVPRDIQDDGDKVLIEMWDGRSFYYHLQTASFTGFICEKWRRSFFSFYTESLHSLRHVLQKRFEFDQITGITLSQSRDLAYMDDPPVYIVRVFALFGTPKNSFYGGYLTDFRGGFVAVEGKKLKNELFYLGGGFVARDGVEVEAKAILCGLQLARRQGVQRIALVSNAKELVDAINTGERQSSQRLEKIFTNIIDLLSEFDWAQIFHDPRLSAQVACQLASRAMKMIGKGFLETEPPDWFIDG